MRPDTILHRGERLHVLKCDFHAHFIEFNPNPRHTLKVLREAGYDVVTLAEHNNLIPGFTMERHFAEQASERYGDEFMVIVGEEVTVDDGANSGNRAVHVLSLFPEFHVDTLVDKDPAKVMDVHEVLPILRQAGGLLFINHDIFTNYYAKHPTTTRWPHRQAYDIDGWEVGNGSVGDWLEDDKYPTTLENNLCLADPATALEEGYILLSNTDYHGGKRGLRMREGYYNVVFAAERSVPAVRAALESRRNVAVAGDKLVGLDEALGLYRQATA